MKNNKLMKTNVLVSIILIIGFSLTAIFSYQANYKTSLNNIKQVSSLTAEGIYYQLIAMFSKPLNVSLTMAHDTLLINHLLEEERNFNNEKYIYTIQKYLETYQKKYKFDSVFLVSATTKHYYNFNGLDYILNKNDNDDAWFFKMLDMKEDYILDIGSDKVIGADRAITVFVDCKIKDINGKVLGIVGVGMRAEHLKELLISYEENFNVETYLINENGTIELSSAYTGYEKINWFKIYGQDNIKDKILSWKEDSSNLEMWTDSKLNPNGKNYIVARYIPELSWYLIAKQNTIQLVSEIRNSFFQICLIIITIILIILIIITAVIRNFNKQITKLIEERQAIFRRSTEQLYDNINEWNITKNTCVGEYTAKYFESVGAKGLPYDQGLHIIANKQIKEEYREGYITIFSPANIMKEYEKGNNSLRYEFMITQDGINYYWIRVDAYIFYSPEDNSIHMFAYRKNIDEEKKKEEKAEIDEMTGFYNKKAAERMICKILSKSSEQKYAFFVFDIDNFKQVNDNFGHLFGDLCIKEFTKVIKNNFKEDNAILGRIGGDEFSAFVPIDNIKSLEKKAEELSAALNIKFKIDSSSWIISASIGISIIPRDGKIFEDIYRNADIALYQTKQKGKNGYTIYKNI